MIIVIATQIPMQRKSLQLADFGLQEFMRKALAARSWDAVYPVLRAAGAILALYWILIFTATHLPARALPQLSSDKFYHLAAFSGLAFLLAAVLPLRKLGFRAHIACVLAVTLGYACFDEWSQQFAAGRSMDIYDVAADACGSVLGLLSFLILSRTAIFKRLHLQAAAHARFRRPVEARRPG